MESVAKQVALGRSRLVSDSVWNLYDRGVIESDPPGHHRDNKLILSPKGLKESMALKSRTYQTQAGETRFSNDINVTDVQFLGQRGDSGGQDQAFMAEEYQEAGVGLPF